MESLKPVQHSDHLSAGGRALATHSSGDLVLFGGEDGQVCVYSTSQAKLVENFAVRASVTDALWAGRTAVVSTIAGTVEGYEEGKKVFTFGPLRAEVTAIALHPCGDILAAVGVDKTYSFFDLTTYSPVLQIATNAGAYPIPSLAFHI